MIYRRYGKTSINLSVIGCGGRCLMKAHDPYMVVLSALVKGINYFDTAPTYGESEAVIGEALKIWKSSRSENTIYVSDGTRTSYASEVRAECETSLKRLGLKKIDLYYMRDVMSLEAFHRRVEGGVLKEMERLREEGLIGHICVSSHMAGNQIGILLHEYPFEGVMLSCSPINSAYRAEALQAAGELGIGVGIMNPLSGGVIPSNPDRFAFLKTQSDETIVQASLRFLLGNAYITSLLVGFSDIAHVIEATQNVNNFLPLSGSIAEQREIDLEQSFDQLCTGCGYCLYVCPGQLPLPQLMDAYNYLCLQGTQSAIGRQLHEFWHLLRDHHNMDKCIDCGACEAVCTQHLPLRERLVIVEKARLERLLLIDGVK